MQTPLVYEGELFPSQKALAEHLGIKPMTLGARIRMRKLPLDALTAEQLGSDKRRTEPTRGVAISFNGQMFRSHSELCQSYGVVLSVFKRRLKRGWMLGQALGIEPRPARDRNYLRQIETLEGRTVPKAEPGSYKLYEIRNRANGKLYIGITVSPLETRWRGHLAAAKKGLPAPLYQAIRKYGREHFEITLIRDDATDFLELQRQEVEEIARRGARGGGYNAALGGAVGTSGSLQVGALVFPSWTAAAAYYGVPLSTFSRRIRKDGWTAEQAAEIAPRGGKVRRTEVEIEGVRYRSLQSAAVAVNIDPRVVRRRCGLGWTFRQALGLDERPSKRGGIAARSRTG
jgi:hypothetical protein